MNYKYALDIYKSIAGSLQELKNLYQSNSSAKSDILSLDCGQKTTLCSYRNVILVRVIMPIV